MVLNCLPCLCLVTSLVPSLYVDALLMIEHIDMYNCTPGCCRGDKKGEDSDSDGEDAEKSRLKSQLGGQ